MRLSMLGALLMLVVGPALGAQDKKDKPKPATPAEEYQALVDELQTRQREAVKAYRAAKTDEEREKIQAEFQKNAKTFPPRFLDVAVKNPKESFAVDALLMVINSGLEPESGKAMDALLKDHIQSDKLGHAAEQLGASGGKEAEKVLRAILEKNPHREVQALATFGLASLLKSRTEEPGLKPAEIEKLNQEAEKLFEHVATKDAHIKNSRGQLLGEAAKKELFELRHLAIGKTAPDVEGEDSDGKKFKLSDYRGKVVVL